MNESLTIDLTPSELILARSEAFCRGDFGFIYDSFHADSNFRRQFTARDEYLQIGRDSLAENYRIVSCEVLAERVGEVEAQVIFLVAMQVHGELQPYAERAWLRREKTGWRYHRGQKITSGELPQNPHKLGFADFARLDPATIF